jgi:hypothetical protein
MGVMANSYAIAFYFLLGKHEDDEDFSGRSDPGDRAMVLWNRAFENVPASLVTVFGMVQGDFSSHDFEEGYSPTMSLCLFVSFMFLVPLVMVNVLIATMVRCHL